ncbi:MAG: bile acid:sodium symporter family protein [Firmicutes bacterium]|nr:bile acid:sodium symporter family protein [Bacillota bacterium]
MGAGGGGGGGGGGARAAARLLERAFFPLLLAAVAAGLAAPGLGRTLGGAVLPLFALMMLAVSLTFHAGDVHEAVRDPLAVVLAALAVFGPLPVVARVAAPALYGPGVLALGFVLLAALPTDISAPLFTAMGRGNTALAAVVNAWVTALSPAVVPAWLLALTGLHLSIPLGAFILQLAGVVLLPTAAGVGARTRWPALGAYDAVWQGVAALMYVVLVAAVVAEDAGRLTALGWKVAGVAAGVVALNALGYLLGLVPWRLSRHRRPRDRLAFVLAVGEKEFSVAVAAVYAGGLDRGLLVPAVAASVLQVATAALLARAARRHTGA